MRLNLEVMILPNLKIHRLRLLYWCTDQIMTEALAKMDLTASQGCIMGYLWHQKVPPCPKNVEEAFALSHSCVSGILSRLEKKGFIALLPDESDRRCKRIHIQEKGYACHEMMHETIMSIEERMSRGFTPEEKENFNSLLVRAIENMGGVPRRRIPIKEEM